jgi:prevent-host-death family protein
LKELTAAEAKARFADCLRTAEAGEPVLVTRHGKPVAAIVGAEDLRQLERLRAASPDEGLAGLAGKWKDGDAFADFIQSSFRAWREDPPRSD